MLFFFVYALRMPFHLRHFLFFRLSPFRAVVVLLSTHSTPSDYAFFFFDLLLLGALFQQRCLRRKMRGFTMMLPRLQDARSEARATRYRASQRGTAAEGRQHDYSAFCARGAMPRHYFIMPERPACLMRGAQPCAR